MCLKSGKCVSENIHLYNVLPKSFLFFCFSCKVSSFKSSSLDDNTIISGGVSGISGFVFVCGFESFV